MSYDLHGNVNSCSFGPYMYLPKNIHIKFSFGLSCWFQIRAIGHDFTEVVCVDIFLVPVLKKIIHVFKLMHVSQ
jgi:hypothetical protein